KSSEPIKISAKVTSGYEFNFELTNDNQPYSAWQSSLAAETVGNPDEFLGLIKGYVASIKDKTERTEFLEGLRENLTSLLNDAKTEDISGEKKLTFQIKVEMPGFAHDIDAGGIEDFIVYAPENSALRLFEREGQIEPLGINGEGLLKLLSVMSTDKNR